MNTIGASAQIAIAIAMVCRAMKKSVPSHLAGGASVA